jgi:hypothetical protein
MCVHENRAQLYFCDRAVNVVSNTIRKERKFRIRRLCRIQVRKTLNGQLSVITTRESVCMCKYSKTNDSKLERMNDSTKEETRFNGREYEHGDE